MPPDEGSARPVGRATRSLGPLSDREEAIEAASWAPAGWFILCACAAALAWALSLPAVHQAFRLEWFLAATALAYPLWRLSRSSWRLGIPSVALAGLQMWSIADEGAQRLHGVGVVSAQTDLLYLAAALQVMLFLAAGWCGVRHNLADARWARLTRRLAALDERQDGEGR